MNLHSLLQSEGLDPEALPFESEPAPSGRFEFEPLPAGTRLRAPSDFDKVFADAGAAFDVDPVILKSIAFAESGFDPDIISGKKRSRAGAIGLMQFMPDTAKEYDNLDPTNPVQSIFAAAQYMRKSLDKFGGDYGKAVASYNHGPNRDTYNREDWDQRVPPETQKYLMTVFDAAGRFKDGSAERGLPQGVTPSKAGAGRGSVSPGMVNTQDVQAVGQPVAPVDTMEAKLKKQGEFSPLEEGGKGLQSGYTGLKQIWESNKVLKDSVLADSMAQRLSAFDRIDAGATDVPRAIGLAYQQADASGRAKIRGDVQKELSSRKDFIGASMETIRQYQAEQQRTKGRTTDLTDVGNLKDFGNWLAFNGASGVVSMAPLMVAAVATGPAAPFVTGALGYGMATGELAGDRINSAQGKLSPQRFSRNPDRYDDAVRAENQNVIDYVAKTAGSTVGAAVPFAALDVVAGPVGSLLKGAGKEMAQKGVKYAAKEIGKDTLEETATGGLQEVIKIATENALGEQDGILTGENLKRVINSAAAEGAGGMVGGAGRVGYQAATRTAPTVESQPTTPQVPPTVAPTTPVTPNAAKTQAVDNIAAAIKELEGGTTQAAPVQPGQQTADTGTAPVAQGTADSGGGLASAGAVDVAGQSESAQSLTDAPLTNEGTTAPTQAVAPAVNPITESMQVARQMADRKGLTAGIQTQLSKGKSIAQATKAMRDDFDEAGIPREEHLTFVHHVSKTLASQPTQQTNPTTQAAPAPDESQPTTPTVPPSAPTAPAADATQAVDNIAALLRQTEENIDGASPVDDWDQTLAEINALSDGSGQSESAGALTQQPVLQNRDRSNPASITQMQSIASNPDYGRLGFSRDFANGAPVVAGAEQNVPAQQRGKQDTAVAVDGTRIPVQYAVVDAGEVLTSNNVDGTSNTAYGDANTPAIRAIAGNGRVAGLTAAYRQGTAAQYKQELMADTALHGVPAEVIQGMQNPVLVRVMPQSSVTANIGDLSNTQGNLSLSAVEQAKNDVSRVNLAALEFDEAGGLTQKAVRQFVQAMPKAEQGGLIDTNGQPSKQAVDRLQAAVFAKAYGNDQLVRLFAQAQDPEARLILSAMAQLAPKIARLEGAGALDIRPIIAQAAEIAVNARREGKSIALAAKQMDMAADPAVGVVLDLFASSPRSNKSIIEAIANAADFAYAEASKSDMDMFGEVQRASRDDVINQLKPQNERASQANLEQPTGRVAAENNAVGQQADTGTTADAGATEAGGPTQEANGQVNEPGAEYSVRQQFSLFGDEQSDQLQLFIDRGPDPVQAGPGAVAAQRDAVAAIADIQSVSSILAAALTRDYAARQRISLVGQRVASAEDLAVLAQVYRDPRFETFRVVFVDANNKVVSQLGLTSRLPASAAALVGTDTYAYLNGLSATAKKAGATGYYLLHNHPSGQARASTSDVRLTNTFEQHLPGLKFQSHVVIDTNEYSTIKGGFSNLIQKDFGQSPPLGATGVTFSSPDDVVAYAKSLQAESGAVTLIATDTQYRVKGVTTIPAAELNGPKGMLRLKVARALMRLQSSNVFAVGRESGALAKLSGIVVDAIHVEDSGRATSLTARGIINSTNLGVFPSDRRTRVTVDSSPEFAYLRFDPSAMKSAGQRVAEGDLLTTYTPAEVTARQDAATEAEATAKRAEAAAARAEAAAKQASEIAQRSVAAADTFELGGNAEDNLSGQQGLRFSRASENRAARAALARIMEKGVTSPDDLRDLLRVPGYSKWAKSAIAGDVAGAASLRRELQDAFPGSDWKAPKLIDQGIITIYPDWVGLTSQSLDKLTKLADKYDTPIGVRGGAATKQLVSRLDGFGFELYNGLQERADRMPNVMFGMIRPAGGITATTPLFSQGDKSPRTPISTITQAITKAYGNLLPRLEGKGLVTLTQTEEEAIAAAAQARADQNGGDVEVIKAQLRKSVLASVAPQTESENFKRWFGDSQVVDAAGRPLVVFHGSPQGGFDTFDVGNVGAFFSSRYDIAASYAGRYDDVEMAALDEDTYDENQGVYSTYLQIKSPMVVDWGGKDWGNGPDGLKLDDVANRAKRAGHDGLIVENVVDSGWLAPGLVDDKGDGNVYVVFKPEQIKSSTDNNGDFDPNNLDIRRSADGNLEGFFDPATGKSFLIADNLTAESAPATLMHEVGIHRAAEGGGKMGAVIERAGGILRIERNNEFVQRVQSRMDEAGETSNEEAAAYIVTEYEKDRTNAPASVKQWIKDFIADVRAWLFNKGVLLKADQLTVADIAAVARANANRMAKGDGKGDVRYSKAAPTDQTQTAAFKAWFGDSKVVDADGKPLVVYHGTAADFNAFDLSKFGLTDAGWFGKGFYFTEDKAIADRYGKTKSVFLSLEKPMSSDEAAFGADTVKQIIAETKRLDPKFSPKDWLEDDLAGEKSALDQLENMYRAGAETSKVLQAVTDVTGFDGVVSKGIYIAFSPTQIKSAIGNNGDFDGNNPDIRRSVRGGGQQAQQNLPLNAPSPAWMLPASTKTDALVYEIQDQKVDLKRTQEAIKAAGRTITEPFDARMAETLMPGRVAYRTETFLKTEVAPLMEAMAKNNVTQNELSDYLLARHAPERNAQIAKVNPDPDMQDGGAGTNSQGVRMTTQAANDYIAALTTGKRMVLQLLANKIDAITASTRDMLVREGLEKQSTMDAWTGAYKHYVPLFKDEAVESPAHPIGSGMSVTGSASKRAMGSEGEVTNMVAHILMQREAAITRAEKNRVAMSLYGLALSNPNQEVWTTIRPNMRADKIGAELAAMGVDPVEAEQGMQGVPTIRTINAVTGLVQETPNPMYKRLENALVVKVDGEDRVVLFNAKNADAMRMVRALKNQDGLTNFDLAGSMVGTATRYFASINTQYNPAFGMVNVVRDIGGALVNLTTTGIADKKAQVFGNIHAAMKGIARDVRGDQARTPWSDLWVQFQEDGGRTGYRDLFIDPFKRAEAVQKDLDAMQRDGKASAGRVAHSILDLLDDFNTTLENGVRLSAYKAALDKGMSRPAAAKMARELTVDFNRKGRTGREVGPLYAFFNASVQGTARTIESLKGPAGKKIIAGGLMLGVIQSLMLAAAGFDDDEPPEFVKARSFIIPMGDKKYIAIPLQFGLNALPNTGRVITDLLLTGGKDAGKKTFNAIGEIMGSFNPLGGGNIFTAHGLLTTVAPTVADPLVDLATNTNFAGTPIGKDRADWDTRPGAKLARESTQRSVTGQVYIGISKAINAASGGNEFKKGLASPTPEQVQYVFTTTGGGLYRELEKTLNIAGLKADGFEIKSRMIPLGGRFAGEADDQDTQRSRYYRNSERLAALEAELKGFDKADDEAAVKRIETERSDEVDLLGDYKHIRQAITKLNKLAADNINDVEMLKELDAERLELMRELNDSVRKLEKRSELFKRD